MSAEKIIKIKVDEKLTPRKRFENQKIIHESIQEKINKIFPKVNIDALLILRREKKEKLLLFIGIFISIITCAGIVLSL
tara:strand:- start:58 stop:294 length:237 start_codon:yes stop_codon:yes gene_type:complete